MEKKDQTDYAAAYRQYSIYHAKSGKSMKAFCEEQNFNYSKFRRYIDKLYWNEPKAVRDEMGCKCMPVEIEKPHESVSVVESAPANESVVTQNGILNIQIHFTSGLYLSMDSTTVSDIVRLLEKLAV